MDITYLNRFESNLQQEMLRMCTSHRMLDGVLLNSEDINQQWDVLAPEYMVDAVAQIDIYRSGIHIHDFGAFRAALVGMAAQYVRRWKNR